MNSAVWLNNETVIDTLKNNNQNSTGNEKSDTDPEKSPEKYDSILSKKSKGSLYIIKKSVVVWISFKILQPTEID